MTDVLESIVQRATGRGVADTEHIQTLWKGYGRILRVTLADGAGETVVVKNVSLPKSSGRKGDDRSHARKVKSYRVETAWYERWNALCDEACRTAKCLAMETRGDEVWMVFEDLDASDFYRRSVRPTWAEIDAGLRWLAEFHATFLGKAPEGLWRVGTYWHLDTRPDELKVLDDAALRSAAPRIDQALRSTFQTFVHGDAKVENFCFNEDGTKIAAVDFQYVGGGCGMKDVAYFVGSCLDDHQAEQQEAALLDTYFDTLRAAVIHRGTAEDPDALVDEWRALYRTAWTDFHRFYKGWGRVRYSKNSYSERVAAEVIENLGRGGKRRS